MEPTVEVAFDILAIPMDDILARYSRQVLFDGIGAEGQKRLIDARVVCIGCGALGTVIANTLARAGVGHLTIVDRDFVEESNLQRQVLFDEDDVRESLPKAVAAERKLRRVNSAIEVTGIVSDVNHTNIESLIAGADLVMDVAGKQRTDRGVTEIHGAESPSTTAPVSGMRKRKR